MIKLSIVIPVLNQHPLFVESLNLLTANLTRPEEVEVLIIDNGSTEKISNKLETLGINWDLTGKTDRLGVITNEINIGVYPTFKQGLDNAKGGVIAFFHSDMLIYEKGWDDRVIKCFEYDNKLGLIGFIGSDEMDAWGGRGSGTMSNFQGKGVKDWKGSKASVHGRVITDLKPAVVVDGCVMIFRKETLEEIGFIEDFPMHHFYDRLMSCQVIEKGKRVAVLGIECDHVSGQTVAHEEKHTTASEDWCKEHLGITSFKDWENKNQDWIKGAMPSYHKSPTPVSWDDVIYREAEKKFFERFKGFFPLRIGSDYNRC